MNRGAGTAWVAGNTGRGLRVAGCGLRVPNSGLRLSGRPARISPMPRASAPVIHGADRRVDGMREPFTSAVRAFRDRTPLIGRVVHQLVSVNIFDSATRLAAQAFLSAIPVLFVIGAFAPQYVRDQLISSLHAVMGLNGSSLDEVQHVLSAEEGDAKETSGIVGAVVTLLSATACSRALQRVCERSWHVPAAGLRLIAWRWVVWLAVWLLALLAQGSVHNNLRAGPWAGVPLSLLASLLLWWWTQWLLLGGRVDWLPLLPGAVLTATGVVGLTWGSRLYMPRTLQRSVDQFGPLGAVFTMLSWLIALFTCITVGIALGYVVAREEPFGRWLGTRDPPAERDRAARGPGAQRP